MLAFVVYSCYKMDGPLGWRANGFVLGPPIGLLFSDFLEVLLVQLFKF